MKKYKDIISGSFLFVVGLVYFALSFTINLTFIDRVVGSRMFPQIIGILMMALSLYIVVTGILSLKKSEAAPKDESEKTLMEKGAEKANGRGPDGRRGSGECRRGHFSQGRDKGAPGTGIIRPVLPAS